MRQSRAGADHLNTTQICRVSEWEVTSGRGSTNTHPAWPAVASLWSILEGRLTASGAANMSAVRLNWLLHSPGRAAGLFLKRSRPSVVSDEPLLCICKMQASASASGLPLANNPGLTIAFSVIFRTQSGLLWHQGGGCPCLCRGRIGRRRRSTVRSVGTDLLNCSLTR